MNLIQTLWLGGDRVARAIGQFLVVTALARGLGVVEFGIFSWAQALVATAGLLQWGAADTALIRWLVREPGQAKARIHGIYAQQLLFIGLSAVPLIFYAFYRPEHQVPIVLLTIGLLGQSTEVLRFWNEAKLTSDRYVRWDQAHYWTFVGAKVAVLYCAPLIHIAAVFALEGVTKALLMARLHRDILKGRPRTIPQEVWDFLRSQVYVFAAYLLTMAALRVPQLWLEAHGGVYEVAYYSAATRLIEPLAFIPWALMSPMFVRYTAQGYGPQANIVRRRMLFLGMSTGFVMAGLITHMSEPLVQVLYGSEFAVGAQVLRVLSWTLVPQFVLLALVRIAVHEGRTKWLAAHGLTQLSMLLLMLYLNQAAKTQEAVTVANIVVASAFVSVLLLFVAQMRRLSGTSD